MAGRKRARHTARKRSRTAAGPRAQSLRGVRIKGATLADRRAAAADEHPEADALVFPGMRIAYGKLAERAMARARVLKALGARPRDHVGLVLHTCPEFVEYFFAIALCGAVAVPINARYRAHELSYVLENGDLVTIVTTGRVADHVDFVGRPTAARP